MRRALAIGAGAVCLAAVAVAIAALSEAGSASGSPISAPGHWGSALDVALAVAFAAYVVGLVLLSRTTVPAWPVLALVAAIQLTPLAGPLLFSHDALIYNALGTISDPFTPRKTLGGGETYGPLWALVSRPLARANGGASDNSAYAFRLLAAACVLVIVLLVWRLASRKALAAALVGWNPAIAFHFAGGGHNDALMMVSVLGALVLASIERPQAGGVSWAIAMAIKFTDWTAAISNLSHQERIDHPSLGTLGWLEDMGIPRIPALELGFVIQVGVFAVFALTAWRRRLHLGLAAGVLILCAPRIDPWYVLWPVSLSAADDDDRWGRLLAVALSGFVLSDVVSTFVNA